MDITSLAEHRDRDWAVAPDYEELHVKMFITYIQDIIHAKDANAVLTPTVIKSYLNFSLAMVSPTASG